MSTSFNKILDMLSEIEDEDKLPSGILTKIYHIEASVVHRHSREGIYDDLQAVISGIVDEEARA